MQEDRDFSEAVRSVRRPGKESARGIVAGRRMCTWRAQTQLRPPEATGFRLPDTLAPSKLRPIRKRVEAQVAAGDRPDRHLSVADSYLHFRLDWDPGDGERERHSLRRCEHERLGRGTCHHRRRAQHQRDRSGQGREQDDRLILVLGDLALHLHRLLPAGRQLAHPELGQGGAGDPGRVQPRRQQYPERACLQLAAVGDLRFCQTADGSTGGARSGSSQTARSPAKRLDRSMLWRSSTYPSRGTRCRRTAWCP